MAPIRSPSIYLRAVSLSLDLARDPELIEGSNGMSNDPEGGLRRAQPSRLFTCS